jgi:lysine/ornithine N-monooxygenase
MSTEGLDLENDHIPGEHVNEYLHSFVKEFSLMRYMRFNTSVKSAVDNGSEGWTLTVVQRANMSNSEYEINAAKLAVATGLTSEPLMPELVGKEAFGAPIYHSSELAKAENGLGPVENVALLNGAKVSSDIAYAYATAGVQVDWIIRKSGHGSCWMMPNRLTPLKVIPELLLQTRLIKWLSPCIWEDSFSYIRNFFHQHWLAQKIVDTFFTKI